MSNSVPKMLLLCLVCLTALSSSGCVTSTQPAATSPPDEHETETPKDSQLTPSFPIPMDYQCDETLTLEWPVIDSVTPNPARPGLIIEVVGHGGVIQCGNFYDESSRNFDVFVDDQRIGSINCYVNHCEGKVQLPEDMESGDYNLIVNPEDSFLLGVE